MKKNLLFSLLIICCTWATVFAQDRKVSGKVTSSDDGTGMPGVSVLLKGTTKGTQTDASGAYSLAVPANGGTLVFTFVGMNSQEVAVGNKSVVNAALTSDTKQLSEVVVTALGIQRDKRALAYAQSSVKADEIAQKSEPDPLRSLTGKVPGVNITAGGGSPGQGTRITIRGNNSFTGNNQPLFVVDGIPFDNSVNSTGGFNQETTTSNRAFDLDPNNIESMTILKGAAASALYGSRAANGVVVVTTKAGSRSAKKGLEVTYNSSYSIEQLSSKPDYQYTYTQGSNQNYSGSFIGNWGTVFPASVDRVNAALGFNRYSKSLFVGYPEGTVPHPLVSSSFGAPRFKTVFPELLDANGAAIPVPLQPYDIIGGYFKTGSVVENGVTITSTGDKTSLNASASRTDNEGMVPNTKATRTNLSFGGNATLANGLILSGNVSYTNTTQQNPQSGSYFADYGSGATGSIYSRLFYLPRNYNLNGYPFENPVSGTNVFYRALDNPLWTTKYNLYTSDVNRVRGQMSLGYDVTPWLNLMVRGGIDTYSENRRSIIAKGGLAVPLGRVTRSDLTNSEMDFTFLATISKDINEKISTKLTLGANGNQRSYSVLSTQGDDITVTGLNKIDATSVSRVNTDYNRLRRLYGIFGELQVSYNNYLFFTASIRNDNSSTLPKANNSYVYPSASLSYVFTDALDIPKNILNFGKFRVNWASVGKDADPYSVNTPYNIFTPYTTVGGSVVPNGGISGTLNNANLKPEITTEFEIGTELQFLNSRIGLDFAYFNRTSKDLIVPTRYAASSGFTYGIINAGEINNSGIEIGLTLVPIKTKSGFTWTSFAAYTRLRSLVVNAGPAGEIFLGGLGNSTTGTIHRNGQPYGMIYGSYNARDADGNLLINPGGSTPGTPILSPDSKILANPAPDFTLGWTNTFSFKGFSLSALIDYRKGGSMFSVTAASLLLRGQLKFSEDREGLRVVPGVVGDPQTYKAVLGADGKSIPNTTSITAFDYHFSNGFGAYGADEVNIYDVTTIRLREVTLGYSVPKAFLKQNLKFLGSLRMSVSGRNLWFYAPNMLKGLNFDPEVLSSFADSNIQGFDLGAAPSNRRFGVNLTATF